MKTLVAYYSNLGSNKSLAEELAFRLNADLEEITEKKKRSFPFGTGIAMLRSLLNLYPRINPTSKNAADYDLVILCAPVWCQRIAAPLKTYIIQNRKKLRRIAFACISGGGKNPSVVGEIEKAAGKKLSASLDLAAVEPGSESKEKTDEFMTYKVSREDLKKEYYAAGIDSFIKTITGN